MDSVGSMTVTSPEGVSASCLPFCPLCLLGWRQSPEHLERSWGRGGAFSCTVCSHPSVTSAPLQPEGELKQRQKRSRPQAEPFLFFSTGCNF